MPAQSTSALRVIAKDPNGAIVSVRAELRGDSTHVLAPTSGGAYEATGLPSGSYELNVAAAGFEPYRKSLQLAPGKVQDESITLTLAKLGTSLIVRVLPANLDGVPGSTETLTRAELDILRPLSVKEALRRFSGLHIVDEDAFGLNLNVGLRGLNPRRTQRTLLMEDGAPVHLAPYSDPTAHYHTPPEIVEGIELVKGSGQILHGPQTVGGMLNFVTEPAPNRFRASLGTVLGSRNYKSGHGKLGTGGDWGGILGHFLVRDGNGVRERHEHRIVHTGVKLNLRLPARQSLQLKTDYYEEDSRFTEAGLSEAQFLRNPFSNPFSQDKFFLDRLFTQALHGVELGSQSRLVTNFYYQRIDRTSYRQIDFPGDEMTANPATGCTGAARTNYESFATLCGNKMRPRFYEFFGIEPRLDWRGTLLGLRNESTAGFRFHRENIDRKRYNGLTPDAREESPGFLFRDWNTIRSTALPGYLQSRFFAGRWIFTPGLRLEHVRSRNLVLRRGNVAQNSTLEATQTLALPGFGVTYAAAPGVAVFGGVHRGFAPPRPDDNFDPLDPRVVPVGAERSVNYEAGFRSQIGSRFRAEATVFRIDFTNQIVPGASVGQPQVTWVNAGETVNSGLELNGRYDLRNVLPAGHNLYLAAAYTRVWTAKFSSDQVLNQINIRGNRLPYAPGHTLSPSLNYVHRSGLTAMLSNEFVGRQFTDNFNRIPGSADGTSGLIPSYAVWNASANLPLGRRGFLLTVNGSNLFDRRFIATRVDGIQVGRPRQVTVGLRLDWGRENF